MATPTSNSIGFTNFNPGLFPAVAPLLDGAKWGGAVGTGVTLSYSFPVGTSWWATNYSTLQEQQSMYNLTAAHKVAVTQALAVWASVSNVGFVQYVDTSTTVGEMRFGFSDHVSANAAAHAYSPGGSPVAGDVWFNPDTFYDSTAKGGFFFSTILHEIGHALGLNHSFNMPAARDNYFYSIMSYTASPWSSDGDNYASFYPTTPMYDDLRAIHAIYGLDTTTNTGNNLYNFTGARFFMTVYDAGGTDQFIYSGTLGCTINLNPGTFSAVSGAIFFSGGVSSRSTVCIGPNTVIENATGGNLADSLIGNSAGNILNGRGGRDNLFGGGGIDRLIGGPGADSLRGDGGTDYFDFNAVGEIGLAAGGRDIVRDFSLIDDYLDFTTIDANPFTALNDAFILFLPPSATFGGARGEMRWYQYNPAGTANDRTFVIGDINGDRVADFRLEIIGLHTLRDIDILQ